MAATGYVAAADYDRIRRHKIMCAAAKKTWELPSTNPETRRKLPGHPGSQTPPTAGGNSAADVVTVALPVCSGAHLTPAALTATEVVQVGVSSARRTGSYSVKAEVKVSAHRVA